MIKKHIIGVDMDGIICPDLPHWLEKILNIFPWSYRLAFFCLPLIIDKSLLHNMIIVTGRSYQESSFTEIWLKMKKINNPIYFSSTNRLKEPCTDITSSLHKVNIIQKLNITKFYESSETQTHIIDKSLKKIKYNCEIVHYE